MTDPAESGLGQGISNLISDEVQGLIHMVEASNISELLVEQGQARIHIRRTDKSGPRTPKAASSEGAFQDWTDEPPEMPGYLVVVSPVVGRFFRASSPDSPPFVEIGQAVKKGQRLCIIEAMKLMSELHAELEGEVAEILAEDGQAVEYGQPLFRLSPVKPARLGPSGA